MDHYLTEQPVLLSYSTCAGVNLSLTYELCPQLKNFCCKCLVCDENVAILPVVQLVLIRYYLCTILLVIQ